MGIENETRVLVHGLLNCLGEVSWVFSQLPDIHFGLRELDREDMLSTIQVECGSWVEWRFCSRFLEVRLRISVINETKIFSFIIKSQSLHLLIFQHLLAYTHEKS